jgi:predicted SprT family Zn-dependent metalloprotease
MNHHDAARLARSLMNEHGLGHWTFQFDRRARTRLGCCKHGIQTLSVSERLLSQVDEATLRNTMLHEIAHALVGPGHGHDAVWRHKARAIGCNGNRCYDSAKVDPYADAPWKAACGCGKVYRRHRLNKQVRHYSRCSGCSTALTWKRVA